MTKAMLTGSFDPVTTGHVELLKRALMQYDEVCVAMLVNPDKKYLFTAGQRLEMLHAVFDKMNVAVHFSEGLAVDLAKEVGADVMVRGIRPGDEEYERELARLNLEIGGVATEMIEATEDFARVSSSTVRDRLARGESLVGLVPDEAIEIINKIKQQ